MDKIAELKIQISDYLLEILMKDDFKKSINLFLNQEFKRIIIDKKTDLIQSEAYKNLQGKIKYELENTFKSSSFKNQISNFIDESLNRFEKGNKTLEKMIPPAVVNSFKVYIYNHKDDLIIALKKLLSNKDIEKRILDEINNAVNGMNPMVARFVNINNIFSRLKISIEDYLNDPKNILNIINFINSQLDIFMKKKISEFSSYFPIEGRKAIVNSLTESVSENLLKTSFIDMLFSVFEEKLTVELSNLDMKSSKLNLVIDSFSTLFMSNIYENLLVKGDLKELVNNISEGIVDNFLSKPLIDLI